MLPKHKDKHLPDSPSSTHGAHLTPGELTDSTLVQNLQEFSKEPGFWDSMGT